MIKSNLDILINFFPVKGGVKITFLLVALFLYTSILAQKEGNIWYFGYEAGIDFNSGQAKVIKNGNMTSVDGCASLCDKNGNIIFYTNGYTLWDRTLSVTPNGSGLQGAPSSCQAGVFMSFPSDSTKFLLGTMDMNENRGINGLRYNVIDQNLNGGNGDIVNNKKNIQLNTPTCEKVIAIPHCNGMDIWLIMYQLYTDSIIAYQMSVDGIKSIVSSNTGYHQTGNINITLGYFKASRSMNRIASMHYFYSVALLMDFDNATGKISNVLKWDVTHPDGVEFSPDDKLLYISGFRSPAALYQYDITSNNAASIKSSEKVLHTFSGYDIGALQLAPDSKIYLAKNKEDYLGVINKPNSPGNSCDFVSDGLYLEGKKSAYGLPNLYYPVIKPKLEIKDTCEGTNTLFKLNTFSNYGSVKWDFGEPSSGSGNFANGSQAYHKYATNGQYKCTVYYQHNCQLDTIINAVNIINMKMTFSLGNDTIICENNQFKLMTDKIGIKYIYIWQNQKFKFKKPKVQLFSFRSCLTSVSSSIELIFIFFNSFYFTIALKASLKSISVTLSKSLRSSIKIPFNRIISFSKNLVGCLGLNLLQKVPNGIPILEANKPLFIFHVVINLSIFCIKLFFIFKGFIRFNFTA